MITLPKDTVLFSLSISKYGMNIRSKEIKDLTETEVVIEIARAIRNPYVSNIEIWRHSERKETKQANLLCSVCSVELLHPESIKIGKCFNCRELK